MNGLRVIRRNELAGAVLTETVYEPRRSLPVHQHDAPQLCLLIEGTYRACWGDSVHECAPGDVVVHPQGVDHWDALGNATCRSVRIEVDAAAVDARSPMHFRSFATRQAVAHLHAASLRTSKTSSELLDSVNHLIRCIDQPSESSTPPEWLVEARKIIDLEFGSGTSLRTVSERVGRGSTQVAAMFRRHFGCSLGDYVHARRITHARLMLADSSVPLSVIAIEAGYSDQAHFSREFKRATGTTPARYRRACS